MTKREDCFDWSEAAVTRLVDMYVQGLTASQIARELGHGLTRNAVIGKLSRLRGKGVAPELPESTITFKRINNRGVRHNFANPWKRAPFKLEAPPKTPEPEKPRMAIVPQKVPETPPAPPTGAWSAPLMHLRSGGCRWPVETLRPGDGDSMKMCGEAQDDGSSYCRFHRKMGTVVSPPPKRKFRAVGHR